MIPINSLRIPELLESHVESILEYIDKPRTHLKRKTLNPYINSLFKGENIESILRASPEKLKQLIQQYKTPHKYKSLFIRYYGYFSDNKNCKFKFNAFDLIDGLGIRVCPYCNRDYIYNTRSKRIAEIDHYYPKKKYPLFALSFYNLIPVCHSCNHVKSDNVSKYPLHPYSDWFKKYSLTFRYIIQNTKLKDPDSIKLLFSTNMSAQQSVDDHVDLLELESLYDGHKDVVCELLQKNQIYNKSYIDELFEKYDRRVFKGRSELMRLITGNYVTKEDLLKRPLSKLNMDISNQIGLI